MTQKIMKDQFSFMFKKKKWPRSNEIRMGRKMLKQHLRKLNGQAVQLTFELRDELHMNN